MGALVLLALVGIAQCVTAQTPKAYKRTMLVVTAGAGTVLSDSVMESFWKPGVSGAVSILFHVSRPVSFGIGFEGTYLPFDAAGFTETHPDIPVHATDLGLLSLSIQGKWSPFPLYAVSPFLSGSVGATHTTAASYTQTIQGKRHVYYSIKPKNRLSLGVSAGADFSLAPWLWIELEARGAYAYHDPDLGVSVAGRAGMQIRL